MILLGPDAATAEHRAPRPVAPGPSDDDGSPAFEHECLDRTLVDFSPGPLAVLTSTLSWPKGVHAPRPLPDGRGPRFVVAGTVEVSAGRTRRRYGAGDVFWPSVAGAETARNVDPGASEVLVVELERAAARPSTDAVERR